ncbi:MAG: helix-turn-helix domain-containing protein, partial [Geodermatophilaceae bacterium]|nr:helix-turn-helix domain-containing protein [Geodermatophilaceae bacterium]
MELLVGRETIRDRLDILLGESRHQIRSFVPMSALAGAQLRDGPRIGPPPGVDVRTVWAEQALADPLVRTFVRSLCALGIQVRGHAEPPMRLLLVDDHTGLVPVDPADPARGCYLMLCPGLVGPLAALFEVVWQAARPLSTAVDNDGPGLPSPPLRRALEMLRDGHTDEAIGRRLGVSSRTVRRW